MPDNAAYLKTREKLLGDVAKLARLQEPLTNDPDHPVLIEVEKRVCKDLEQQLWYTMLYFAYMHLPSAHLAFQVLQHPADVLGQDITSPVLRLPTGFERRGLRTAEAMRRHLSDVAERAWQHGGLRPWLMSGFEEGWTDGPKLNRWDAVRYHNWQVLQATLQTIYGNGRWAGYNTGEGLMNINSLPVLPTDMGMHGSTGPLRGLELLCPEAAETTNISELDQFARELLGAVRERGADIRIDELETVLCDFHSLFQGGHYVGHYSDLLQQQLLKAEQRMDAEGERWASRVLATIWKARQQALPRRYLGELNGWVGEDKQRLTHYRRTGEIIDREGNPSVG